jgi:two-component system cell cycle response regulator DivK
MASVLVIDDYAIHRDLLVRWLVRWGHRVAAVPNGAAGIAYAATDHPDLILLDMELPGMDGLEVTRCLKADPATAQIRVLALTAHASRGVRERCLAAGCDDFEYKPMDFAQLDLKIQALCARTPSALARSGFTELPAGCLPLRGRSAPGLIPSLV